MKAVRLPAALVKQIDELRGLIPRERWVRDALAKHIASLKR